MKNSVYTAYGKYSDISCLLSEMSQVPSFTWLDAF